MGVLGFGILLVGALVLGILAQAYGKTHTAYEWAITGIAAGIGAFIVSEYFGFFAFGPEYDGLMLMPALLGAVLVGGVAYVVTRVVESPTV